MARRKLHLGPVALACLTALVSVLFGLFGNMATSLVTITWPWWPTTVWTITSLLGLATVWLAWRALRAGRQAGSLDDAERALRKKVHQQWTDAAILHAIQPMPIRLRWSSTEKKVAAARKDVDPDSSASDWRSEPFAGDAGDVTARFKSLRHRQLVVLGKPGAGKTVLAILLTLGLLEQRAEGDPVPVLIPINSWNPDAEIPEDFVKRRIAEDYDFLSAYGTDARDAVDRLIADHRILVILDGLDELDSERHVVAIRQLNSLAVASWPMVVTCRTQEYEVAVSLGGEIMAHAAVVEIAPIGPGEAIEFLSYPEPQRHRWEKVFEALRIPGSPLAVVLSTPLMLSLARTAYSDPKANPADLVALPTPSLISATLFDGFVTGVYPSGPRSRSWAGAAERRRVYRADRARSWLRFMAYVLNKEGSRDLRWELLYVGAGSRRPKRAEQLLRMVAATCAGVLVGVAGWFLAGPAEAVVGGAATAALIVATARHVFTPLRTTSLRRGWRTGARDTGRWLLFAVLTGAIVASLTRNVAAGLAAGLVGSLTTIAPAVVRTISQRPAKGRRLVRAILIRSLPHGAAGAFGFAGAQVVRAEALGWIGPVVAFAVCGGAAAMTAGGWWWIRFQLAHAWFAARLLLPVRLRAFIRDGYERNLFRRGAGVWQFRHALLQDHLALDFRLDTLRRAGQHDEADCWELAELLVRNGRIPELRERAATGDRAAEFHLADTLLRSGDIDAARVLLERLAKEGVRNSVSRLADLYLQTGAREQAIAVLQDHVRQGEPQALTRLAEIYSASGRIDEAISLMKDDVARRDDPEARGLVRLLVDHDRTSQLRALADGGNWWAAFQLGQLLVRKGERQEAIELGTTHARRGDAAMVIWLANLLAESFSLEAAIGALEGRTEEWSVRYRLERLLVSSLSYDALKRRALAGDNGAASALARLPGQRRLNQEGRELLERRAAAGDQVAASYLAGVLAASADVEGLRGRARAGDRAATVQLARLLDRDGKRPEAIRLLRAATTPGYSFASLELGEILAEMGHADEAVTMARPFADRGDKGATLRLAKFLARDGRVDEAAYQLLPLADKGDEDAARQLADLLVQTHRLTLLESRADGGDRVAGRALASVLLGAADVDGLRARARLGDRDCIVVLAGLLARRGAVEEALGLLDPIATLDDGATRARAAILRWHGRTTDLVRLADHGDFAAGCALADEFWDRGRPEAAADVLKSQVTRGDRESAVRLVRLHGATGEVAEALRLVEPYALAGDWDAGRERAEALASTGRVGDLKTLADRGERHAILALSELLIQDGDIEAAIELLREANQPADSGFAVELAKVYALQGNVAAGLACLRPHQNEPNAVGEIATLLITDGRTDQALSYLARHAVGGAAARELAKLLDRLDRVDELRARAAGGDIEAALVLADRIEAGEAIEILLLHQQDQRAAVRLVNLLNARGDDDRALAVLRRRTDTDPKASTHEIIDQLVRLGRVEELRARASGGDSEASVVLAGLLAGRGDKDAAAELLRPCADTGNDLAREELAQLLGWSDYDELDEQARTGDDRAARRLSDLLLQRNRVDEALDCLSAFGGGRLMHVRRTAVLLRRRGRRGDADALLGAPFNAHDWDGAALRIQMMQADREVEKAQRFAMQFLARDSAVCTTVADLLFMLNEPGQAVGWLRRYTRTNWRAADRLAEILMATGDAEGALGAIVSVADPWHRDRELPRLLSRLRRRAELKALAGSGNYLARVLLAKLLAESDELDEATALVGTVTRPADHQYEIAEVADVIADRGGQGAALTILRALPSNEFTDSRIAELLTMSGDLQALASQAQTHPPAALALASLLSDRGDTTTAADVLRPHAADHPDAAVKLANLLAATGRVDEAISVLREHLEPTGRDRDNVAVRLAGLLADTGEIGQAVELLRSDHYSLIQLLRRHKCVGELRTLSEQGDMHALRALCDLLPGEEAAGLLRGPANADVEAARQLADLLRRDGNPDQAMVVLRRFAWEDEGVATDLAELLADAGHLSKAIDVLLPHAVNQRGFRAPYALIELFVRTGDDRGLEMLSAAGATEAALRLAGLAADRGDVERAIAILNVRAGTTLEAAMQLADLYSRTERRVDAETLMRDWAPFEASAAAKLAEYLVARQEDEEAVRLLSRFPRDSRAADVLVPLLERLGRIQDLRTQLSRGNTGAAIALARLLTSDPATVEEGLEYARRATRKHRTDAARLLLAHGREEELRKLAASGEIAAAMVLADSLRERNDLDDGIAVLRPLADTDERAASMLASMLVEHDEPDQAIDVLMAYAGRWYIDDLLMRLLAQQGRTADLETLSAGGNRRAAATLAALSSEVREP